MHHYFRHIIAGLILAIFYLLYLIGVNKYSDLEVDNYATELTQKSTEIEKQIEHKKIIYAAIQTPSYQNRIAKTSLNKQLPGEVVTNIVSEADLKGNENINVVSQIYQAEKVEDAPTKGMSNPEKWMYYLLKIKTDDTTGD